MAEAVYKLKATVRNTQPPIWREVLVPNVSLLRLHGILQTALGWQDKQQHQFVVQGKYFGMPGSDNLYEMFDESQEKLSDAAPKPGSKFRYLYDLTDHWEVDLELENIAKPHQASSHPVCVAGERLGPPENCGGAKGYYRFLKALRHPDEPDSRTFLEKIKFKGSTIDPDKLDLSFINRHLGR